MPRTIDGFAPRPSHPLQRQQHTPRPRPVLRPSAAPRMPSIQPEVPRAAPMPRRVYSKPVRVAPKRRGVPERLQLPLIITGAMLAGIFAQSVVFGELLVVGYGICALVWRIASRTTFTLALLSMVATTLLLVVRGNITLSQNFATYTFLLLVVGVITLIRELKKEGGRIYSSRKNIS